ncbi:MAG: hypothetical protein GDA56_11250 [Hormoscilla sp. GM7CHS1pb]|nr:hypothetical protein [Hormoscilla sp. GM7CHS1pb]
MTSKRQIVRGTRGDEFLLGGKNDDILHGGGGKDRLKGLGGKDIFAIPLGAEDFTTVDDFSIFGDKIVFLGTETEVEIVFQDQYTHHLDHERRVYRMGMIYIDGDHRANVWLNHWRYNIPLNPEINYEFKGLLNDLLNDLNEPTDLELSNNSIDENVAANTVVGTFSTTDPDTEDSFTYQLVAGAGDTDNAAFTIVGDQLQINSSPDFETQSSYSILVQTTDPDGLSYSENFTININDLNEPTDLELSNNSIDENVAANTVVGTFSTTDPDTGDIFTYQLVAGTGDTDNAAC